MTGGPGAEGAPHPFVPEAERRQYKELLDAYEAAQREQAPAGSDQPSGDDEAPTAT